MVGLGGDRVRRHGVRGLLGSMVRWSRGWRDRLFPGVAPIVPRGVDSEWSSWFVGVA